MPCFRKHSAPGPTSCDPNSPSRWHQVGGLPQFFKFSVILSALALALLPLCSWDPGQCLLTSAGELGTWDVSPLHSHMPTGTCTGLCCPPFPHALWDLLIPFHTHYYFFFPKPKALLLYSFTLTAYSCQASHFITLQSSIWITQSHMLCLWPGPFHLLSIPFFTFSHQILVSCLIQVLCCSASACIFPRCFSSLHAHQPTHLVHLTTLPTSGSHSQLPSSLSLKSFLQACSRAAHQPMNSALLSSSAPETHTHTEIYIKKKERLKASEDLTRQAS